MTTSLQPQLIQRLERKFLESFVQLLELKCMTVEEKTALSSRGVETKKLSHAFTCLSLSTRLNTNPVHVQKSLQNLPVLSLSRVSSKLC